MMNPTLSVSPLRWKKTFLVPPAPPYWFDSFASRLPQLIDRISTSGDKEQKSKLGCPLPSPAGPGLQPLPNTCPGQAGARAWHQHSRSEGYANMKRLGTPGLTRIGYHTEHPEILSPLHNPIAWRWRGEDPVHHTHSEKNTEGDGKTFALVTPAECGCELGAYFEFSISLISPVILWLHYNFLQSDSLSYNSIYHVATHTQPPLWAFLYCLIISF